MLHEFLVSNRIELIARCRNKVEKRLSSVKIPLALDHGVPLFLQQLVETLRSELERSPAVTRRPSRNLATTLALLCARASTLVDIARQTYAVIKSGQVGATGSTGNFFFHTLEGLRSLTDRTLAEIRRGYEVATP